MSKTFHQLHVRNPEQSDRGPLTLTFTNRKTWAEVDQELYRLGYEVDRCPGYKLYDGPKAMEEALSSVRMFCRPLNRKPRYGEGAR